MENKQTAVKYIESKLIIFPIQSQDEIYNLDVIRRAKQMEKENMKHAFDEGSMYDYDGGFEEYYKEFYGK